MQAKTNTFTKHKFIHKLTKLSILFLTFIFASIKSEKADLVAFSFNRPIQLYALLESLDTYVTGLEQVHIIYRSTNENYEQAYQEVIEQFPYVIFHKQGANPKKDFKPLTLHASFDSPCAYILFAVDDIIVKDFINIENDIELLKETNAYGFYYRLGLNINWNYPYNRANKVSKIEKINDDVHQWHLKNGTYDWGYPNTVDMTMYKKSDIQNDLKRMHYHAPNPLEGNWARLGNKIRKSGKTGLCHEKSKIVNLPLNRVQNVYQNRHMNTLGAEELLEKFNQGLKIDITLLYQIKNRSAHMDYVPQFIERVY
ncbi:hypothetical protein ACFLYU_00200 [Candidatus Dependentiae bacterium]